jgi:hypothetical protein
MSTLIKLAIDNKAPSKAIAQDIIRDLAEQHPDSVRELAQLYAYFMPPKPKKPKTAFQWVSAAAGVKDIRYYINYVYVTAEHLTANDGHRLHRAPNTDNLAPGYYHPITGDLAHPPEYSDYTDIAKVIPAPGESVPFSLADAEPGEIWDGTPCYAIFGAVMNARYLHDAMAFMPSARIQITGTDKPVRLDDGGLLAVIMPLRP